MLRLVGLIVIAALIVGPLLAQAGMLDNAGWFRDFVDLEIRGFVGLFHWASDLAGGHHEPPKPAPA